MTPIEFENALTTAGLWFFLYEHELIKNWKGDKADLIAEAFKDGFDSDISGTTARINASLRIIGGGMAKEALEKIRDSKRVNAEHPSAREIAIVLLKAY